MRVLPTSLRMSRRRRLGILDRTRNTDTYRDLGVLVQKILKFLPKICKIPGKTQGMLRDFEGKSRQSLQPIGLSAIFATSGFAIRESAAICIVLKTSDEELTFDVA